MALTDNLVAYWKLDESSGDAADSSGGGYTLTNVGTMPYGTGKINNGILPDGTNRMLNIANNLGYAGGSQNMTWNGWINATSWSNYIMQHRTSTGTDQNLVLYGGGDSKLHLLSANNDLATGVLSTATWYMVTITKSGTTFELFVNTSSIGTIAEGNVGILVDCFALGANTNDGSTVTGSPFSGKIDEWGVWSRTLSGSELTELYNSGNGLPYSSFATAFIPQIIIF